MSDNELYVFVAHTNLYAGNFERQMTAYATGQVGECGVGDTQSEAFQEEFEDTDLHNRFYHAMSQEPDDNGCYRPCAIWPTPGRYNNGRGGHFDLKDFDPEDAWQGKPWPAYESVGMFFSEQPAPDLIELMKNRCLEFAANSLHYCGYGNKPELKIIGFQLLHRTTKTTVVDVEISI